MVNISAGYLSDMELGRVPSPTEQVIIDLANALRMDKKILLEAASKVDPELSSYVKQPQVADFLRMAKDQEFNSEDWERITQLAKLSRLGKDKKEIE